MRKTLWTLDLLLTVAACSGGRSCPVDERTYISEHLTIDDVCTTNGYVVIVRFLQPQTIEEFLPLLDPLRATLACEDPGALLGQPGKTCYIIRLGSGFCCSDANAYFTSLDMPLASTSVPHPATPCSCETHWTQQ